MKIILVIISFFILCGCARDGLKEERTNNHNFKVDLLFEYDGIKVYRFHDNGRYHYFTSRGEAIMTQAQPMGKMVHYYDENIK